MSTSLQQQLQRLAVPQTRALQDATYKASIIFDPKEAATKDRRTIFDLGVSGLRELQNINATFRQFESTLFYEPAVNMERAVETSEVNDLLDRNINKFLRYLSPYLLLRPAHLCLEWLLRRFHINEYNRAALFGLALPYYETLTFTTILQTVQLSASDQEWGWLRPLQRPGVPLAKSTIITRAATNPAFLKFICKTTANAVKELGGCSYLLQTQINFYSTIVVGALEQTRIESWHTNIILPSVIRALKSKIVDYISAGLVVTAQLVTRCKFNQNACNGLIRHIVDIQHKELRRTAVMLLVFIFETQYNIQNTYEKDVMFTVISYDWFVKELEEIISTGVSVHALLIPLFVQCTNAIQQEKDNGLNCVEFIDAVVELPLPDVAVQRLLNAFLSTYVIPPAKHPLKPDEVIELNSDAEGIDFVKWYSSILYRMETRFPQAFEAVLKSVLSSGTDQNPRRQEAIQLAIQFRLKSCDTYTSSIYQNLYHHNSRMRMMAVQTLRKNLENYKSRSQNYQILKECVVDRITDDSEDVVAEALQLSTEHFVEILGFNKFLDVLFETLHKAEMDAQHWEALTPYAVNHMVSLEVVNNCDSNLILLALMPLLLPSTSSQIAKDNIITILRSPLANKLVFLKEIDLDNVISTDFDAVSFKIHFLGVIAAHMKTPTVTELFSSVDAHQNGFFRSAMDVSHIMMLVISCLNQRLDSHESLKIFKQIRNYTKDFEIKHIPSEKWQMFRKRPYIPLRLYVDFVSKVVEHTNLSDDIYNWTLPNKDLEYLLYIVNFISEEVFRKDGGAVRQEWLNTIQQIFDVVFPRPYTVIDFFANFYVYRELNCEINYTLLRLKACILFSALCRKLSSTLKFNLVQILKITMGLHASSQLIRFQAMSVLSQIKKHVVLDPSLLYLIDTFLSREKEIFVCCEQAPLLWYTLLKPTKEEADVELGNKLFKDILKLFNMRFYLEHSALIAEMLAAFKHIDDMDVLQVLMPLAFDALDHTTDDGTLKVLAPPFKNVYNLIMQRFELADSAEVLMKSPGAWELFKKSCQMHNVYLVYDDKMQPVPCLLLNVLDGVFYGKLNKNSQLKLFKLILRTLYTSDNDKIFQAANKMFNKCIFEGNMLRVILQQMLGDLFKTGKTSTKQKPSALANAAKLEAEKLQMQITTQEWKEGVIVLQLLEQRKIILHTEQLISVLFDLLKVCLEVEEQNTVEYAKQLILTILLQCCEVCKENGIAIQEILPENTFRIDHIVDYVRSTQNPQTHHNALLLLAHCSALYPQQVLHNVVEIFTFVGSTIARHDDAFSFYIINTVVEKIIPILLEHSTPTAVTVDGVDGRAIPLLKVFADIVFDVPEHRRLLLYTKFLNTLGHKEYLWSFLCILFEAHITDTENEKKKGKPTDPSCVFLIVKTTRFQFAIDLVKSLETSTILETCLQLLMYLTNLSLMEKNAVTSDQAMDSSGVMLFDVKCHTKKQFRHYKYIIIEFLHNITCEHAVMVKIAKLTDEEQLYMKVLYQSLVVKILTYIPKVKATIAEQTEGYEWKLNKAILNYLHDLLENVILMLSPNLFLMVINGLVLHNIYSIRRKVMELLINKLLTKETFFSGQFDDEISKLFEPFNGIVDTIGKKIEDSIDDGALPSINTNNDAIHMQQTTLICIKVLSKTYGTEFIEEFKGLLAKITKVLKFRKNMPRLLTSAVIITIAEIASNLRVHCLAYLPRFMPYLINVLQEQTALLEIQPLDNTYAALVLSFLKLLEAIPLFLSPYMVDIITSMSLISVKATHQFGNDHSAGILQKISAIWKAIATKIQSRVSVPLCEDVYNRLIESHQYSHISELMKLLSVIITETNAEDWVTVQLQLTDIFMQAIQYRILVSAHMADDNSAIQIQPTETIILDTLVTWIMKLTEVNFRPVFQRIHQWALKSESASKETHLTFYLFAQKVSAALQTLFVIYAGEIVEDTAELLKVYNATKNSAKRNKEEDEFQAELLMAIFGTLCNVFRHQSRNVVSTRRFDLLIPAIVDQIENRVVLESEDLEALLILCISELAAAANNDLLVKQLNQQVMLKSRKISPEVRILTFNCCVEIARQLGDAFTPLLPETLPFIAELLEDDNVRVEKCVKRCIHDLESILGESLQQYF